MASPINHGVVKLAVGEAKLSTIPIPKIRDGYLLVKTAAVALNPTDWQTVDEENPPSTPPLLLGCDAAGVVVEVGKGINKPWKKGDRIACIAHGGNEVEPTDGSFAEYILMKGDIGIHLPDHVSFEQGAAIASGINTAALSMYSPKTLGFQVPTFPIQQSSGEEKFVLIYGGSSASGTIAIQFAKFDAGPLLYVNLLGIQNPRSDVESRFMLGYTASGERFVIEGQEWPASPEDFDLAKTFVALSEKLLEANLIKNHPIKLMEGGLGGILDGMQYLKDGKICMLFEERFAHSETLASSF
ncbi:putative protein TOXD [Glarea lozoyensis 74030]|uniref:Enoyl reductase (ER) domain-containing protein n=1 Tax=Glarea lozoyensis (strain ATCC 74030 / MF5533) TaxID=1104152 RepID=H0EJ43_GLAL7|nr:putative protein TOXD [Glarea lozoyensis 74030]